MSYKIYAKTYNWVNKQYVKGTHPAIVVMKLKDRLGEDPGALTKPEKSVVWDKIKELYKIRKDPTATVEGSRRTRAWHGIVYVHEYHRTDGTPVDGHTRRWPERRNDNE